MSDIGILSSPGDGAFLVSLGILILLAAAIIICLVAAVFRTSGNAKRMIDDRFFGYFIGASATVLVTTFLLLLINQSDHGVFAHWADDWHPVWLGGLISIWLTVAYLWNRWRRGGALREASGMS